MKFVLSKIYSALIAIASFSGIYCVDDFLWTQINRLYCFPSVF